MPTRKLMYSGSPCNAGLERDKFPAVEALHAKRTGVAQLPPSAALVVRLMGDTWKDIFQGSDHALGGPFIHAERVSDLLYGNPAMPAGGHASDLQQLLCILDRIGGLPRQFLTK